MAQAAAQDHVDKQCLARCNVNMQNIISGAACFVSGICLREQARAAYITVPKFPPYAPSLCPNVIPPPFLPGHPFFPTTPSQMYSSAFSLVIRSHQPHSCAVSLPLSPPLPGSLHARPLSSDRDHESYPCITCAAVRPSAFLKSHLLPISSRRCSTPSWLYLAARCKGMQRSAVRAWMLAPRRSSRRQAATQPLHAALCRAVQPCRLGASI